MKHRIGNDLPIEVNVTRFGEPENLNDYSTLAVRIKSAYGDFVPFDFMVDGSTIKGVFYGKDQKMTGDYIIELVKNAGEVGMITLDQTIVTLVDRTAKEQDIEECDKIDIEVNTGKNGLSAYELARTQGFEGTLEEYLDSLHGPFRIGSGNNSAQNKRGIATGEGAVAIGCNAIASGDYSFAEGSEGIKCTFKAVEDKAGQYICTDWTYVYILFPYINKLYRVPPVDATPDDIANISFISSGIVKSDIDLTKDVWYIFPEAAGTNSHQEGCGYAKSRKSHAEGNMTIACGSSSHAEGEGTQALASASHAEGFGTSANHQSSHAEGSSTVANANYAHAEGSDTIADGEASHAEGYKTQAKGHDSHSEGRATIANAMGAHAEGLTTNANGPFSHTEGHTTQSQNKYEHAEGQSNRSNKSSDTFGDKGNTLHSVGIGTSDTDRKNAYEIMQNGDAYLYGLGGYNGKNPDKARSIQEVIASAGAGGGTFLGVLNPSDPAPQSTEGGFYISTEKGTYFNGFHLGNNFMLVWTNRDGGWKFTKIRTKAKPQRQIVLWRHLPLVSDGSCWYFIKDSIGIRTGNVNASTFYYQNLFLNQKKLKSLNPHLADDLKDGIFIRGKWNFWDIKEGKTYSKDVAQTIITAIFACKIIKKEDIRRTDCSPEAYFNGAICKSTKVAFDFQNYRVRNIEMVKYDPITNRVKNPRRVVVAQWRKHITKVGG